MFYVHKVRSLKTCFTQLGLEEIVWPALNFEFNFNKQFRGEIKCYNLWPYAVMHVAKPFLLYKKDTNTILFKAYLDKNQHKIINSQPTPPNYPTVQTNQSHLP